MYRISFYAPEANVEEVKNAMFKAGAGKVGNYACCSWQTLGEGQCIPLEGSNAFLGKIHHLERIAEYKVEMVCIDEVISDVVAALLGSHPYEAPAYQVIRLEDF